MSKEFYTPTFDSRSNMSEFDYNPNDLGDEQEILTFSDDRSDAHQNYMLGPSPDEISLHGSRQHPSTHLPQYNVNHPRPIPRSNMDPSQNTPVQPQAADTYSYTSGISSFPVQPGGLGFASPMGNGTTGFGHPSATNQSQRPSESAVGGGHSNQQRNGGRRQEGRSRSERQGRESSYQGDGAVKHFQGFR
ncbi:uncharacterized protein [Palaemon carinicauda]